MRSRIGSRGKIREKQRFMLGISALMAILIFLFSVSAIEDTAGDSERFVREDADETSAATSLTTSQAVVGTSQFPKCVGGDITKLTGDEKKCLRFRELFEKYANEFGLTEKGVDLLFIFVTAKGESSCRSRFVDGYHHAGILQAVHDCTNNAKEKYPNKCFTLDDEIKYGIKEFSEKLDTVLSVGFTGRDAALMLWLGYNRGGGPVKMTKTLTDQGKGIEEAAQEACTHYYSNFERFPKRKTFCYDFIPAKYGCEGSAGNSMCRDGKTCAWYSGCRLGKSEIKIHYAGPFWERYQKKCQEIGGHIVNEGAPIERPGVAEAEAAAWRPEHPYFKVPYSVEPSFSVTIPYDFSLYDEVPDHIKRLERCKADINCIANNISEIEEENPDFDWIASYGGNVITKDEDGALEYLKWEAYCEPPNQHAVNSLTEAIDTCVRSSDKGCFCSYKLPIITPEKKKSGGWLSSGLNIAGSLLGLGSLADSILGEEAKWEKRVFALYQSGDKLKIQLVVPTGADPQTVSNVKSAGIDSGGAGSGMTNNPTGYIDESSYYRFGDMHTEATPDVQYPHILTMEPKGASAGIVTEEIIDAINSFGADAYMWWKDFEDNIHVGNKRDFDYMVANSKTEADRLTNNPTDEETKCYAELKGSICLSYQKCLTEYIAPSCCKSSPHERGKIRGGLWPNCISSALFSVADTELEEPDPGPEPGAACQKLPKTLTYSMDQAGQWLDVAKDDKSCISIYQGQAPGINPCEVNNKIVKLCIVQNQSFLAYDQKKNKMGIQQLVLKFAYLFKKEVKEVGGFEVRDTKLSSEKVLVVWDEVRGIDLLQFNVFLAESSMKHHFESPPAELDLETRENISVPVSFPIDKWSPKNINILTDSLFKPVCIIMDTACTLSYKVETPTPVVSLGDYKELEDYQLYYSPPAQKYFTFIPNIKNGIPYFFAITATNTDAEESPEFNTLKDSIIAVDDRIPAFTPVVAMQAGVGPKNDQVWIDVKPITEYIDGTLMEPEKAAAIKDYAIYCFDDSPEADSAFLTETGHEKPVDITGKQPIYSDSKKPLTDGSGNIRLYTFIDEFKRKCFSGSTGKQKPVKIAVTGVTKAMTAGKGYQVMIVDSALYHPNLVIDN
jgi:hypothetical protein